MCIGYQVCTAQPGHYAVAKPLAKKGAGRENKRIFNETEIEGLLAGIVASG